MRFLRSFAAAAVVAAFMGAAVASPVVQEGTGVGKHGDVKVAVTFDNGKIQDIKVLSQKENPVLAQRVFKDLRQEVIDTERPFLPRGFLTLFLTQLKKLESNSAKPERRV